jgi:hypothetical protein
MFSTEDLFITILHVPRRKQPLSYWKDVFTVPFHSNGSYSIVACVFVAARMCLPCRCLAINIYSDFDIPAFVRHVTVLSIQMITIVDHYMCTEVYIVVNVL